MSSAGFGSDDKGADSSSSGDDERQGDSVPLLSSSSFKRKGSGEGEGDGTLALPLKS